MGKNDLQLTTVGKALQLVDVIARSSDGLSLTEVSELMKLPKSSVIRYLKTLEKHEFIERDEYTQRYFLGSSPLRLVSQDARQGDIRRAAYPLLQKLRDSSGETVNLAVPMWDEMVFVETLQSLHPMRTVRQIGEKSPMHSTAVGKAVLAWLPPDRLDRFKSQPLVEFTENTITVWPTLLRELEKIRKNGFAIDDREGFREFRCVGAPIFDFRNQVVASLAISAPQDRLSMEQALDIGPEIAEAGLAISRKIGYGIDNKINPHGSE